MIKSKFSVNIVVDFIVIFSSLFIIALFFLPFGNHIARDKPQLMVLCFVSMVSLYPVIFGRLRKKMIRARMSPNSLRINEYVGLSNTKKFAYAELDGYKISQGTNYECLYIMKEGRTIAQISQFYLTNYPILKELVECNLTFMGVERPNASQRLRKNFHYLIAG